MHIYHIYHISFFFFFLIFCFIISSFTDYIFSNNKINNLIYTTFIYQDDEIMPYYISMIKSISFFLNYHTSKFFFNEVNIFKMCIPLYIMDTHIYIYIIFFIILLFLFSSNHFYFYFLKKSMKFPLYTESLRLYKFNDIITRTYVKNIILNILKSINKKKIK